MKKYFVASAFVLIVCTVGWYGCSKKSTTAPVIYLSGNNPVYISLGTPYNDAGATATDATDGTITSSIVVKGLPINTNLVGTYTIYYDVTDKEGNAAYEVTRTVYVVNDAANYAASYNESTLCSTTQSALDTITASSSINNRLIISDFGLNMAASIYADVSSLNINIPSQTVGSHVYWGTGTISNNNTVLVISYNDSTAGIRTSCSSTYTKH
jgi:hypothetical protein